MQRLEDLLDPRHGAPHMIGDGQVEAVVTQTLEPMPANNTHWKYAADGPQTPISSSAKSNGFLSESLTQETGS